MYNTVSVCVLETFLVLMFSAFQPCWGSRVGNCIFSSAVVMVNSVRIEFAVVLLLMNFDDVCGTFNWRLQIEVKAR